MSPEEPAEHIRQIQQEQAEANQAKDPTFSSTLSDKEKNLLIRHDKYLEHKDSFDQKQNN